MSILQLTIEQAVSLLQQNVKGAEMVTVDLDSDMDGKGKMRKTGNRFIGMGIVKRETLNGVIGYIYARSIERLVIKEGKEAREVKIHPWGDMDEKHLFRIHRKTGKPYLSMKVENVTVHGFFAPDGTEIDKNEIRTFIPEKRKSSTQADLDGEVIPRDYSMENIRAIRMRGVEIQIV
jgi:hypothetical protein